MLMIMINYQLGKWEFKLSADKDTKYFLTTYKYFIPV